MREASAMASTSVMRSSAPPVFAAFGITQESAAPLHRGVSRDSFAPALGRDDHLLFGMFRVGNDEG
jgi:hypothetical protein